MKVARVLKRWRLSSLLHTCNVRFALGGKGGGRLLKMSTSRQLGVFCDFDSTVDSRFGIQNDSTSTSTFGV